MARRNAAVTRGFAQAREIFVARARNAELWDVEARRCIDFAGGYHGRTLMTLSLTGKVAPHKSGFGPFPSEVLHVLVPLTAPDALLDEGLRILADSFAAVQ